jgi:hypothetical protein
MHFQHGFNMERPALNERFRNIITLASLAYTFTTIHSLQYYMRNHDNDTSALNLPDNNESIASSSTPTASGTSEKTSGRWTDDEIQLLLHYVATKCTLTTARVLNLKKSQFNEARETVKTKDAGQCHYKWGHVCFFIINNRFDHLSQ